MYFSTLSDFSVHFGDKFQYLETRFSIYVETFQYTHRKTFWYFAGHFAGTISVFRETLQYSGNHFSI